MEIPWFDGDCYHYWVDDDDDDDEDPLGKQPVERGNFDADPPMLLRVVVGSNTMRTMHNPDWYNSNHSPKRLSPWWNHSHEERHPSESRSLEAVY